MSLEKAIEENNVLKVKELLSKGVRKKEFEVAIQEAASSGQTEILDAFLEAGTSKKMLTLCLGWAVRKNQNHLISALVDAGANVNLSRQFETPLSYAAQAGNVEGAALLLAAGADPNYALEHGEEADKIPLTVAIEKGHTDLVKVLIDAGARLNYLTYNSQKPLDLARAQAYKAQHGDSKSYKEPQAARAAFKSRNPEARLPALETLCSDMTILLEKAGATATIKGEKNIIEAARTGDLGRLKELLPVSTAKERSRPLALKDVIPNTEVVKLLVTAGVLKDPLDKAFYIAVQDCAYDTVRFLATNNISLDKLSSTGLTPLIRAIATNNLELTRILIELGADVNKADSYGESPLDSAKSPAMKALLEKHGAKSKKLLDELKRAVNHLSRMAYYPRTKKSKKQPALSQFGGQPLLASEESWPGCPSCQKPFCFFFQLDMSTFPGVIRDRSGYGLLQFFYCTVCKPYKPFASEQLTRILAEDTLARLEPAEAPKGTEVFPARILTKWSQMTDLPYKDVGPEDWREIQLDLPGPADRLFDLNHQGDKLGGWPNWVQDVTYPACPKSELPMRHLFQLDSNDTLPYQWGDSGVGFIFQSPKHPDILTFFWQSA